MTYIGLQEFVRNIKTLGKPLPQNTELEPKENQNDYIALMNKEQKIKHYLKTHDEIDAKELAEFVYGNSRAKQVKNLRTYLDLLSKHGEIELPARLIATRKKRGEKLGKFIEYVRSHTPPYSKAEIKELLYGNENITEYLLYQRLAFFCRTVCKLGYNVTISDFGFPSSRGARKSHERFNSPVRVEAAKDKPIAITPDLPHGNELDAILQILQILSDYPKEKRSQIIGIVKTLNESL